MELTLAEEDKTRELDQDELFWLSSDNDDDILADEPAPVDKEGNDLSVDDQDTTEGFITSAKTLCSAKSSCPSQLSRVDG